MQDNKEGFLEGKLKIENRKQNILRKESFMQKRFELAGNYQNQYDKHNHKKGDATRKAKDNK